MVVALRELVATVGVAASEDGRLEPGLGRQAEEDHGRLVEEVVDGGEGDQLDGVLQLVGVLVGSAVGLVELMVVVLEGRTIRVG